MSVPLWGLFLPPARPLALLSSYPSAGWFLPQIYKDENAFHPSENKGNQVIADRFFPPEQKSELRMCTNFTLAGFFFFFKEIRMPRPQHWKDLIFQGDKHSEACGFGP